MNSPRAAFSAAFLAADADGNGEVEIIDATWIQRSLVLFDVPYPIGETVVETEAPTAARTEAPTAPKPTRDPDELPVVPKK